MKNVLIINSCNSNLLIALKMGEKVLVKNKLGIKKHNEIILDLISEILNENDITLQNIDEFGVVVGPGSFTGIRVGIATIKAFKDALKKQAKGINNLEFLFNIAQQKNIDIVAIEGSLNSYFIAEKTEMGLHIYPHNVDAEFLKNLAQENFVGCFEISEQMKETGINFKQLEVDASIMFNLLEKSTNNSLTPVYYQLSQAESEKIKRANLSFEEFSNSNLEYIIKIDADNFSLETNGEAPWDTNYFSSLIANPNYKTITIKLDEKLVGFAVLEITDEINISRIAVDKAYQSMGIATKTINYIFNYAKSVNKNVSLEVCEHNINAYKLYKKLGFKTRRIRKNYYKDKSSCIEMIKLV